MALRNPLLRVVYPMPEDKDGCSHGAEECTKACVIFKNAWRSQSVPSCILVDATQADLPQGRG